MSVELVQKRNEIEAMLLQQARIAESNYIENVGSAGVNAEKIPYYFKPVITRYLMEQKNVSGVGNIYKSESLFLSALAPHRKVGECSEEELLRLYKSVKTVLKNSLESGDTWLETLTIV